MSDFQTELNNLLALPLPESITFPGYDGETYDGALSTPGRQAVALLNAGFLGVPREQWSNTEVIRDREEALFRGFREQQLARLRQFSEGKTLSDGEQAAIGQEMKALKDTRAWWTLGILKEKTVFGGYMQKTNRFYRAENGLGEMYSRYAVMTRYRMTCAEETPTYLTSMQSGLEARLERVAKQDIEPANQSCRGEQHFYIMLLHEMQKDPCFAEAMQHAAGEDPNSPYLKDWRTIGATGLPADAFKDVPKDKLDAVRDATLAERAYYMCMHQMNAYMLYCQKSKDPSLKAKVGRPLNVSLTVGENGGTLLAVKDSRSGGGTGYSGAGGGDSGGDADTGAEGAGTDDADRKKKKPSVFELKFESVEQLAELIATRQADLKAAQEEIARKEQEINDLSTRPGDNRERIDELRAEIAAKQGDVAELTKTIADLRSLLPAGYQVRSSLNTTLDSVGQPVADKDGSRRISAAEREKARREEQARLAAAEENQGFWSRVWGFFKRNWGWIVGGLLVIGGSIWGVSAYNKHKDRKEAKKQAALAALNNVQNDVSDVVGDVNTVVDSAGQILGNDTSIGTKITYISKGNDALSDLFGGRSNS